MVGRKVHDDDKRFDQIAVLPKPRSKQLPPNDLWRHTPYECLGILFEYVFLLVSSSKYHIPARL
jgi:hypothetical protein